MRVDADVDNKPASQALMDQAISIYRSGKIRTAFEMVRSDGHVDVVSVQGMCAYENLDALERCAMRRCTGRVLEIGAGMGRHTRNLIGSGLNVTALDISEQCVSYLNDIGITNAHVLDVRNLSQAKYDTVLMLGNGLGMLGSIPEIEKFMATIFLALSDGGKLLCDSVDMLATRHKPFIEMREENLQNGRHEGEVQFQIRYGGDTGEPFTWIYLTENELISVAARHDLSCEVVHRNEFGQFLVEIFRSKGVLERPPNADQRSSTLNIVDVFENRVEGTKIGDLDKSGYLVIRELLHRDVAALVHRYAILQLKAAAGHFIEDSQTGCPSRYADALCEALMEALRPNVELLIGRKLLPTYSYLRFYENGAELRRHKDRRSCEISLTITLGYSSEQSWPIWVEKDGTQNAVHLDIGDAMVYKGIEVPHWREPFCGKHWLQVFLHYVESDGPHADQIYDGRRGIGP